MERKDIVIASLEFAREKLLKGESADHSHLNNHLLKLGYIKTDGSGRPLAEALFKQICAYHDPQSSFKNLMSLDAYLGLLDYEELQLARQDSQLAREEAKTALNYARWSLWLATAVGIAQIVVQIWFY